MLWAAELMKPHFLQICISWLIDFGAEGKESTSWNFACPWGIYNNSLLWIFASIKVWVHAVESPALRNSEGPTGSNFTQLSPHCKGRPHKYSGRDQKVLLIYWHVVTQESLSPQTTSSCLSCAEWEPRGNYIFILPWDMEVKTFTTK